MLDYKPCAINLRICVLDNFRESVFIFIEFKLPFFSAADSDCLSHDVDITAEALWNYLSSHTDWKTLLQWVRAMAQVISPNHDNPHVSVGETFTVQGQTLVLPKLTRSVFSQMASCHKVVREMILEELTRSV